MTTMGPSPEHDASGLCDMLGSSAAEFNSLAAGCDAICLSAGTQLGDSVPGLFDLANQFVTLSAALVDEDGSKPARSLEVVARDILAIGSALSVERDAVEALISINGLLSQRIVGLAEHVRFLSAVVSNVKIEIASIDESEHRLEGFADNLKQLASKSEATVSAFQETHKTLISQLQHTSAAQSAFVTSHGKKFKTASLEISDSLRAVSDRRNAVAAIAAEIGTITQRIGAQIAQCVVALQVGDSTRQRLEHVGEALAIASEVLSGAESHGVTDEALDDEDDSRGHIVTRICGLESLQASAATKEFCAEIRNIAKLIKQIAGASATLRERNLSLVPSSEDGSRSFLADLEAKLASAGSLIDECGKSRKLVDDTAEQVIHSVSDLQELAKNVSAMATDMMIIGTNAVVTSYRLGTKGIPLSVIAQHLRNHAVHVTDAVKLVSPALDKVRAAAREFTSAREGRDAGSMTGIAMRINEALAAFQASDNAVADVNGRLEAEVANVGGALHQASDALDKVDGLDAALQGLIEGLDEIVGDETRMGEEGALPPSLDQLISRRYTMESERAIHGGLFASASSRPVGGATGDMAAGYLDDVAVGF